MKMLETLYKGAMVKSAIKDVASFVKDNWDDFEFDKEYWLNKAGLSTYKPARGFFGGFSLLLLGAGVGAIAALAFAPKAGTELRTEIKDKALKFLDETQFAAEQKLNEQDLRA